VFGSVALNFFTATSIVFVNKLVFEGGFRFGARAFPPRSIRRHR
jgi:hypothetical protein